MTRPTEVAPPTSEIGYVTPYIVPGWKHFGIGTGFAADQYEEVAELRWPMSILTYHRMRTDSQIDALTRSVIMPLMRLNWSIAPNGARPEVVDDISAQLNLPTQGQADKFIQRGRRRFNHGDHMRQALLAPTAYGHMFFEQVGEIDPDDLKWKMTALRPRMPQTIQRIDVEINGDLIDIIQNPVGTVVPKPIPATQLAPYVWEREGANWLGRSMLRPLYKHWVIKDLLLRIDTMKNERYGLGVPVGTAAPGGDPASMQAMASAVRAVEGGGVGLANGAKLGIQGVTGTLPDTLASIRYQDESMARTFLAMFMQLGQTETGSRALGSEFVNFFIDALAGFANWYAGVTNQYVIEDIVDWNWGENEQAPLLVWEERDEEPLGVSELAALVKSGALLIDAELQSWIRKWLKMPDYTGGQPLPTRPGVPLQEYAPGTDMPATVNASSAYAPAYGEVACEECGSGPGEPCVLASGRLALGWFHGARVAAGGKPSKGTPKDKRLKENKPKVTISAAYNPDQPRDAAGRWSSDTVEADDDEEPEPVNPRPRIISFMGSRGCDGFAGVHAASSQTLDDTSIIGHREPNANEVKAATDFRQLQQQWESATADLVSEWGAVRSQQIEQLVADVTAAVDASDFTTLATLSAPVLGKDTILKFMTSIAVQAISAAIQEAKDQGIADPTTVDVTALGLEARAEAIANLVARDLGGSASRNAVLRYGTGQDADAAEIAAGVRDQLEALTDAYLNDTLGGGMTQAQNTARRAVISANAGNHTQIYASELLDERTCEACASEDGTQFANMTEAEIAYPAGGYSDCSGGPRCRGTLVAVYGETD